MLPIYTFIAKLKKLARVFIKKKRFLFLQEFVENLADLNDGHNFPAELLFSMYSSIKKEPIQWLEVGLSIYLSIYPSIYTSIYLHLSIYLSIYLFIYLSIYVFTCLLDLYPAMIFMRVDFPAPLGPMMAVSSPLLNFPLTPCTTKIEI